MPGRDPGRDVSTGGFRDRIMETVARWTDPPGRCDYQADHICRREYLCVAALQPDEYMEYLRAGWRRFGHTLFRLSCSGPDPCRSLRVDVARFRPDRSQRRARKANDGSVRLRIGAPGVSPEKLALFDRFHAARSETRGWPCHEPYDVREYARSFVLNPFPIQEWCYYLDDALVGVGYVDHLAGGLSAIYFAHEPNYRDRSLGTWNVLCLLDRASALGLPHVYLGYYTEGCPSLQYKARFRPNQSLHPDGHWRENRP
jgi:arginyl-tRNA--protein-N-Asp/Glu arginylyltransferase